MHEAVATTEPARSAVASRRRRGGGVIDDPGLTVNDASQRLQSGIDRRIVGQ